MAIMDTGKWTDEEDEETADQKDWSKHVAKHLHAYGNVFSKKASERMPTHKVYDHSIEFEKGAPLPRPTKGYPMSPAEQNSLDTWIDEQMVKGYIKKSKSPVAASVFFVKKKDETLRLVQDYRKLNEITTKNRFSIPRISDLIDQLSKASIFTKLDLRWGYNNVRIKAGDEWKTAFTTHRGLFEANVMFFGFCNAPATFQAMMNEILKDLILEGHVVVYLDDILIYTDDILTHRKITKEVLKRLWNNDLFAKPEKCFFEQLSIGYLRMIISKGSVSTDQSKVKAVLEWPVPTKVKQVQAFLGFANFYRHFIRDFSKIAQPLFVLLEKSQEWIWSDAAQKAYESLKEAFTTAPILKISEDNKPFRLETDSSNFATGAVLEQLSDDGIYHPVAYYSKSLNEHERNYEIYDKEMLAIIRALEE